MVLQEQTPQHSQQDFVEVEKSLYQRAVELGESFDHFKDDPKYLRRLITVSREYTRKYLYMENTPQLYVDTEKIENYDLARSRDHDALCVMLCGKHRNELPPEVIRDVQHFAFELLGIPVPEPRIN